jgi:predicted dehydrogenase
MHPIRLMTLDPGHFHAALVQKEMYPDVDPTVHVYAPLGPDLDAHLARIAGFNSRADQPTVWQLEVHAGPDSLQRMLHAKPGNVVVLSGRNRTKIDAMAAAVDAGLNVLADKPWIIEKENLPKLAAVLDKAEANGLVAYDIMTERFEITSILQRELVNDPAIFGEIVPGSESEPGVDMESVHYLLKLVAGVPNRRPPWFFDIHQQGEGLTDVGTHLVDLVPWILFPEQAMDYQKDVRVLAGKRWPTVMSCDDFRQVTGADFPDAVAGQVRDGGLPYFCNNRVQYMMRGVHVRLTALWDFQAAAGTGDTHLARFHGTRAVVEVCQGKEENYRPELYVVPRADQGPALATALRKRIDALQARYPGLSLSQFRQGWRLQIPDQYRVGHEAHFGQVTRQFLRFLKEPKTLPAWEKPNMLAKYFVTTEGVELARKSGSAEASGVA